MDIFKAIRPTPMRLDPDDDWLPDQVQVHDDYTSVSYVGQYFGGDRVVRTAKPFPATYPGRLHTAIRGQELSITGIGYCEVHIHDTDVQGNNVSWEQGDQMVSIGLCSVHFPKSGQQPGWRELSCGYHGDDGHKFCGNGQGTAYGPTYGKGDTVGVGIDYYRCHIFFTKNGENIGVAYTRQQKPHLWLALGGYRETELSQMLYPRKGFGLFPIVGIDTSSKISFNFGQKPFMFDVSSYDRQLWVEFRLADTFREELDQQEEDDMLDEDEEDVLDEDEEEIDLEEEEDEDDLDAVVYEDGIDMLLVEELEGNFSWSDIEGDEEELWEEDGDNDDEPIELPDGNNDL